MSDKQMKNIILKKNSMENKNNIDFSTINSQLNDSKYTQSKNFNDKINEDMQNLLYKLKNSRPSLRISKVNNQINIKKTSDIDFFRNSNFNPFSVINNNNNNENFNINNSNKISESERLKTKPKFSNLIDNSNLNNNNINNMPT